MNKPPKTEAVLIRLTPEQKAAYQAQGGAKWVRAMIDALIRVDAAEPDAVRLKSKKSGFAPMRGPDF